MILFVSTLCAFGCFPELLTHGTLNFILTPPKAFSKSHLTDCVSKTSPVTLSLVGGLLKGNSQGASPLIPAQHAPSHAPPCGRFLTCLGLQGFQRACTPSRCPGCFLPRGPAAPHYCGGPAAPSFPVFPSPAAEAASIAAGGREGGRGRPEAVVSILAWDG